jgi:hypothetical protein
MLSKKRLSEGHRGILKLPSLADPASQLARHLA